MEIWKDIKYWEELYKVSNFGNVFSKYKNGNLKPRINNSGYYTVILCKNGEPKNKSIHRLVAEAFIPNPENKPYIDHIKHKEKLNNHVSNLRWSTPSENNLNRGLMKNNTSGEKDIYWDKTNSKWEVRVTNDGVQKFYGRFTELSEAIKKRDEI